MKKQWEPMKITLPGHVAKIVQCGGGTLSVPTQDDRDRNRRRRR